MVQVAVLSSMLAVLGCRRRARRDRVKYQPDLEALVGKEELLAPDSEGGLRCRGTGDGAGGDASDGGCYVMRSFYDVATSWTVKELHSTGPGWSTPPGRRLPDEPLHLSPIGQADLFYTIQRAVMKFLPGDRHVTRKPMLRGGVPPHVFLTKKKSVDRRAGITSDLPL